MTPGPRDKGTPEQELALAVVLRAVEDLDCSDEQERFEAHEFFLQPKGPWADMRRFYFALLGLEDEWLHEHLTARLTAPERPERKWSFEEIYAFLPRNRAVTTDELAKLTGLMPGQVINRLTPLRQKGLIVSPRKTLWVVAEFEAEWRELDAAELLRTGT